MHEIFSDACIANWVCTCCLCLCSSACVCAHACMCATYPCVGSIGCSRCRCAQSALHTHTSTQEQVAMSGILDHPNQDGEKLGVGVHKCTHMRVSTQEHEAD
eukprot:c3162_g1_i1 orf=1-303(-)